MKRDSRKKQKEENPENVKSSKRRENERQRKGSFDSDEGFPCAICFELRPGFPHIGNDIDHEKKVIKRKATLALEAARSESLKAQSDGFPELAAMEKGTRKVVNNEEQATTQTEAEYGGAWEEESDIEEDVDWKLIRPKWLVRMAAEWAKECGRVKRVISWNLDHGTKDEHERLRWKLRKLDKYVDWLWLDLQKLCKDQENLAEETCADEEEKAKNWALNSYKELYTVEYETILCRFCPFCKRKKPNIE